MSSFKKATREQARLRMALQGPSGSGKTRSALEIAHWLVKTEHGVVNEGDIAVIDTEHGSAAKYEGEGRGPTRPKGLEFVVCEVTGNYNPDKAIQLLKEAADSGAKVVVIDSLSHFWNGSGGFLELVDKVVARDKANGRKADSFAAWKEVDPIYRKLVQALLGCPAHVIACLRAKTEYSREGGKVEKVGMAPEIREGFTYEMDVEGMMDMSHTLAVGKTRCEAIDGEVFKKPGKEFAEAICTWLSRGAPAKAAPVEPRFTVTPEAASAFTDWNQVETLAASMIESATAETIGDVTGELTVMLKGAPTELKKALGASLMAAKRAFAA
jgi:hypothetical protein